MYFKTYQCFSMFSMMFNDVAIFFHAFQRCCRALFYTKANLDETWGNSYLHVSRSFLYSAGTSETIRSNLNTYFYIPYITFKAS